MSEDKKETEKIRFKDSSKKHLKKMNGNELHAGTVLPAAFQQAEIWTLPHTPRLGPGPL